MYRELAGGSETPRPPEDQLIGNRYPAFTKRPEDRTGTQWLVSSSAAMATSSGKPARISSWPLTLSASPAGSDAETALKAAAAVAASGVRLQSAISASAAMTLPAPQGSSTGRPQRAVGPALARRDHGQVASTTGQFAGNPAGHRGPVAERRADDGNVASAQESRER